MVWRCTGRCGDPGHATAHSATAAPAFTAFVTQVLHKAVFFFSMKKWNRSDHAPRSVMRRRWRPKKGEEEIRWTAAQSYPAGAGWVRRAGEILQQHIVA